MRAMDCVKFQTKRRVRLPKRANSSYGSQHGSSAAGTAAQAPQLAGKRKHSLGFGIVIVIENIVNGIFGSAQSLVVVFARSQIWYSYSSNLSLSLSLSLPVYCFPKQGDNFSFVQFVAQSSGPAIALVSVLT